VFEGLGFYLSRLFERFALGLRGRGAIARRASVGQSTAIAVFATAPDLPATRPDLPENPQWTSGNLFP